ncbi:MAG: RNA polymerase sigma-70 factor [Flavobacteriales bacterium]|nr:RNA polymerase sigma-70 factor [Flavobacteriales bacterium]
MDLNEKHILEAIKGGNQKEFEMLFRKLYRPLCLHARTYLQSNDEAEEVVQSVFIGFWEKRNQLVIDTSVSSYLYRSVRNHTLNVLKHEKVKRKYTGYVLNHNSEGSIDHAEMESSELEIKIADALQTLPEQCRLVFTMSRYREMKYAEIADELGISIKTVENHMGKALRMMREELKDYLPIILILMNGFL